MQLLSAVYSSLDITIRFMVFIICFNMWNAALLVQLCPMIMIMYGMVYGVCVCVLIQFIFKVSEASRQAAPVQC